MKYAVFTVGLPEYTPEEAVAVLAETGYDGVEWRVTDQQPSDMPGFWAGNRCTWPLSSFVEDAAHIRQLTLDAGLELPSVGTYVRCDDLDAAERAMRGAALLGAPKLRVNVPPYDGSESYLKLYDQSIGQYREVEALAKAHGLQALVEIHMHSLLPSASAAASFLSHFDTRYVGAIHDAGNMVYEGYEQYRLGLEVLGPYLSHVHLKNAAWRKVGTRPDGSAEWRATWAPIREGAADLPALFHALHQVGYDGWVSFEDFSTERPLLERVRDNLVYVGQIAEQEWS